MASSKCCCVRLTIAPEPTVRLRIDPEAGVDFAATEYIPYYATELPDWEGPYEVIPRVDAQVFGTNEHAMRADLTVTGVPYAEVTNESGGLTASIAS